MTATSRRLVLLAVALCAALFAVPAMANSGRTTSTRSPTRPRATRCSSSTATPTASLTAAGSVASGGLGSGSGLGSQGAVILDDHAHRLFAVNAGSDSVSSFAVTKDGLELVDTAPSGGDLPISLTYDHGILYVLNAGTPNSISGLTGRP